MRQSLARPASNLPVCLFLKDTFTLHWLALGLKLALREQDLGQDKGNRKPSSPAWDSSEDNQIKHEKVKLTTLATDVFLSC